MQLVSKLAFALILALATNLAHAQSNEPTSTSNERFAVGIQLGLFSSGLSGKYRLTDTFTVQGTAGFFGLLNRYGVRGLYAFNTGPFYEIYGYGGLSIWRFGGTLSRSSETAFGIGAGGGIEYDLRGLNPTLPPLFAAWELGANLANFNNFSGFTAFGTTIALHYRF